MNLTFRPLPAAILCMGLLAGSKAVGLIHHIGVGAPAHATTTEPTAPIQTAAPAAAPKPIKPPPSPAPAEAALPPPETCAEPMTDTERTLLQDLRERRRQLDDRAAALDRRETLLTATNAQLGNRIDQLTELQAKLENLDAERRKREDENWKSLVKTYESMKPREAAAILDDVDNTILVQVLDRMKERNAALILASMSPERARLSTKLLAQWRNQVSDPNSAIATAGARK